MKPTAVDRYTFTADEVLAAILPNVGYRREFELRIDADGYVVVDIVQQPGQSAPAPEADDAIGDVAQEQAPPPEEPEQPPERPQGEAEQEARSLCATPLFRAFLEVKTEEAALRVLPGRCHVEKLEDLDRTKSTALNLRYLVEEYEGWKLS
ncbi:hypothetical protein OIU34_02695 [Pararhizobium sp. BT-229]|uniref:hypothetical protein n=1 Tax=Pararhizobium sp. BT-229 TaxID=2986923 RepID=UPI0021F7B62C|nr:hypothetical protein [Pararhizobium sp. BT-229]MCV9960797.1 hypothetical protein [Pararhizobium sp. BT-229]